MHPQCILGLCVERVGGDAFVDDMGDRWERGIKRAIKGSNDN